MIGYESQVVNGQLVNVAPHAGYDPIIFGPSYTGPGMWPRQGAWTIPPVMPSGALQKSMSPPAYGYDSTPLPTASSESGSPYHPTKSPLWMALGFLILGILMLQYIHYK